jgi:dCMP deaminase
MHVVSYAAINAILNKSAESLDGCTMYMTKCPRTEEAKLIIQVGIKEVIYFHKDTSPSYEWAQQLLYYAGVRPTWYLT